MRTNSISMFLWKAREAAGDDEAVMPTVFEPSQPRLIESGVGNSALGRRRPTIRLEDETDNDGEEDRPDHEGGVITERKRRTSRRRPTVRTGQSPFNGLRFIRTEQHSTHHITAIFDNPIAELRNVKLMAVGEDGNASVVGLKNRVEINGRRVTVKNNAIRSVSPSKSNGRVVIKFDTQEPIIRDGQTLTSFQLKHGDDPA